MASEIRVNQLTNRAGLGTITFANGGVQFSGITTFANGEFYVGTGATIINPSSNEFNFHTGGSNRFTINNSGVNIPTLTATTGTFSGNVSVGGVLTYEDVKNVDAIGIVTAREGIFLPDSKTIKLGNTAAIPDFTIEHNGTHSIIDTNTGDLILRSDADDVKILSEDDIVLRDNDDSTNFIHCINGAGVKLYNAGNERLYTTNTGIDVTGVVVADDIVITGTSVVADFKSTNNNYVMGLAGNNASVPVYFGTDSSGNFLLATGSGVDERLRIDSSGRMGLGTNAPDGYDNEAENFVVASSNHTGITIASTGTDKRTNLYFADGTSGNAAYRGAITYDHASDYMMMRTAGTEKLRITSGGYVNIGGNYTQTTDLLQVDGTIRGNNLKATASFVADGNANTSLQLHSTGTTGQSRIFFGDASTFQAGKIIYDHTSDYMMFGTGGNGAEKMRITSTGVINIGKGDESSAVENLVELYVGGANESHATIRGKYNRTNQFNRSEVRFGVQDNSAGKGFLAFATGTNSATERVRIRASGQVEFKNGSFSDNVNCIMASGSNLEIGATATIKLRTATNERLRIDSTGSVHVGFSGESLYFQNGFNNSTARIQNAGASNNSNLRFLTRNAGTEGERLRITETGNVGIDKTSAISARLHIGSDNNDGSLSQLIKLGNDSSGAGTGTQINMGAAHANESTAACIAGMYDGTGTAFIVKTAGTYSNQSTVGERLRITSNGAIQNYYNTNLPVTDSRPILQLGYGVIGDNSSGYNDVTCNAYPVNGNATYHYIGSSSLGATRYQLTFSDHIWSTASAGTRGNDITWSEKMRLTSGGYLILGPDAQDIQIIPHSSNSGHGQIYFRGNASNESSSIKLNHYGHADYVIGAGRHSNGMFSITRSDTGTDGLLMNNAGKVGVGKVPETLTGNGFNAKLQVNTGASNDYDGILIGGGYTRSTIQNGPNYDLILTSNAYPANATSKGIRFKCGTNGGGGPHERMRIHQSGMSEWKQHGGSKTYEYRSSVTGVYNSCTIVADCHAYHSFAIEVDISGYAYKYIWGKYYGYENGGLYAGGNPGQQDRYSSSQYITHSHDGGHKHKFLCYISSATHPQCGIKITVGGPDAYIDDGDITFTWA